MNALGDVLKEKAHEVQALFDRELEFNLANRKGYYETYGPDRFEAELEAAIVEKFEGGIRE